jgi:hypothetical protein
VEVTNLLSAPNMRDGEGGVGLGLGPDLVDDDHFRGVVLDRFDHRLVLQLGAPNLWK